MKRNILIMMIAALLIGFLACNKDENEPGASKLEASKTEKIKLGEPVLFKFSEAPAGSAVQWTVSPDNDVKVTANGNTASILFGQKGNYFVNATLGTLKGTSEVSIQDSIYNPGGGSPTIVPLTGDQIAITVTKMPDSIGKIGLNLAFVTKNKYKCMNNSLLFTRMDENNTTPTYKINFSGVEIPADANCTGGESLAQGATVFYPIAVGNSALEIILNGIVYKGSINKTGSTITISWTYTSGVTISPLVLN
jgi:hypothetical protein